VLLEAPPLSVQLHLPGQLKPKASPGAASARHKNRRNSTPGVPEWVLTKTMSRLCEPCLSRHGAAQECLATHETEGGLPICVFCMDGEPCLHDRKVVASQRRLHLNQTMEENNMQQQGHEPGDQVTTAVPTTVAKKICRTPG
jgi:hypothetical protein